MLFNAGVTTMMSVMGMLTPPSGVEYMAIIPGAIVAILSLVLILVDAFHRPGTRRDYLAHVSVVGLALALASTYVLWDNTLEAPTFHGMLYLDKFSLAFAALACISGALSLLQVPSYLRAHRMDRGEFYMLVLFSVVGTIFMASAADLLTIFLALEVMSIPVYCLAGFLRRDERSAEAAMKYFILGAFSAAIMLYGMALIYGITGTTNLEIIGLNIASIVRDPAAATASGYMLALGALLVVSGFAFKIAAAPFHSGMPDIYTGSPSPAVGFMSTAVKAGAFAAMIDVLISVLRLVAAVRTRLRRRWSPVACSCGGPYFSLSDCRSTETACASSCVYRLRRQITRQRSADQSQSDDADTAGRSHGLHGSGRKKKATRGGSTGRSCSVDPAALHTQTSPAAARLQGRVIAGGGVQALSRHAER